MNKHDYEQLQRDFSVSQINQIIKIMNVLHLEKIDFFNELDSDISVDLLRTYHNTVSNIIEKSGSITLGFATNLWELCLNRIDVKEFLEKYGEDNKKLFLIMPLTVMKTKTGDFEKVEELIDFINNKEISIRTAETLYDMYEEYNITPYDLDIQDFTSWEINEACEFYKKNYLSLIKYVPELYGRSIKFDNLNELANIMDIDKILDIEDEEVINNVVYLVPKYPRLLNFIHTDMGCHELNYIKAILDLKDPYFDDDKVLKNFIEKNKLYEYGLSTGEYKPYIILAKMGFDMKNYLCDGRNSKDTLNLLQELLPKLNKKQVDDLLNRDPVLCEDELETILTAVKYNRSELIDPLINYYQTGIDKKIWHMIENIIKQDNKNKCKINIEKALYDKGNDVFREYEGFSIDTSSAIRLLDLLVNDKEKSVDILRDKSIPYDKFIVLCDIAKNSNIDEVVKYMNIASADELVAIGKCLKMGFKLDINDIKKER